MASLHRIRVDRINVFGRRRSVNSSFRQSLPIWTTSSGCILASTTSVVPCGERLPCHEFEIISCVVIIAGSSVRPEQLM
jgi:hypothetical protein